ncbi:hypothetical protein GIB67_024371 [Kingdonia uniflora]|uniref:SWIM-type domain-containing protein n=1 Tax=Kingdonia uniflora TaxID=39325 RepID=A0A7J7LF79_9MAGN|nr:hypothetical protein GIB67_024371 [Kingdonia uniflora]
MIPSLKDKRSEIEKLLRPDRYIPDDIFHLVIEIGNNIKDYCFDDPIVGEDKSVVSVPETHKSSSSSSVVNDSLRVLKWDKVCDSVVSFAGTSLESKRLLAKTNAAVEMINYGGSGGMDFSDIDVELTRLPLVFFPATGPLIGAIAAGNAVVLKPSELVPACSAFLANTIPSYMDDKVVMVVEGGASVGKQLLDKKWDKIFFTVIVDSRLSPSQMQVVVKRIVGGKWGICSGQACIGVDYLLMEDKFAPSLIKLMKKTIKRFHGDNPKELNNMARIVNKHHFERLFGLLQDHIVVASIVHGSSLNEEKMTIEPTILLDPPLDTEIMTEEIFEPLLPDSIARLIQHIAASRWERNRTGLVNLNSCDGGIRVICDCQNFEFTSILCKHIFKVFSVRNIMLVPEVYFTKRWMKMTKMGLVFSQQESQPNYHNSLAVRYNNLSHLSLKFCAKASMSINSYQITKQNMEMILRELEKVSEEEDMITVPESDIDHITNLYFPLVIGNNIGSSDHLLSEEDQPLSSADQVVLYNAGVVDKQTGFWLRL